MGGAPETGRLESSAEANGVPRRILVALALAAGVAALILALFVGAGRRPPLLPGDVVHHAALSDSPPATCLVCHARDAARPVPAGHTGRRDCSSCHDPS